ncbi:MAG: hypothetical protein UR28_C0018G0002 [Candidatus Peregrinibacteria bacterium GW2011_GWF2_33_10]|nr:MAG: hypothetical protein UR28_C0018G0002 [Candidatus Peregrinibacteria bacterium GW2011_GWF2_33_10]OGJ46234.1 MAG: hypothetical protein A2263_05105 [Candidatus Peregrinibacteria bacterium RIFOXYA2_FULL_33_21]OGJ46351.1 MAG: hypothetical protein A2272_01625 [Candidatus Peregrinibacteria bacterium RIFOXYA12_FULL_33_12]OGJ50919.1 MAG: hypothetical protein A2307_01590 [Candidatus Peregrinibacteria bacterium RIFOXYB2_FULL_33_20]
MASKSTSNLISAIILIVIIPTFVFVLKPMLNEVNALRNEIADIQTQIDDYGKELDSLQSLNKDLPPDQVSRDKLLQLAPEGLNQSQLIQNVNDIALKNNITLHSVNFDKAGTDELASNLHKVAISASFTGEYDDLIKFLKGVEANMRAIVVKTINLQRDSGNKSNAITFNLYMEAYYQE